jgi:putative serine protease PepD
VTPGGAADRAGLQPGEVIVEIEGEPAHSVDPLVVKTLTLKPGDTLDLKYQRHGESHTTALRVTAEDAGCARVNLP